MKIENFAELPVQEQRAFAEALIKTINSESTFSSDVDFKITNVEADDMSGCLFIDVDTAGTMDVKREASWTCSDSEEAHDTPEDPDFVNSIYEDAKEAFKIKEVIIDGYKVLINDIVDVNTEETVEVEVDNISHEDAGIGHYEFWGETGYDSDPYCEVEGTLTVACYCSLVFEVEPVDEAPIIEEAAEEN